MGSNTPSKGGEAVRVLTAAQAEAEDGLHAYRRAVAGIGSGDWGYLQPSEAAAARAAVAAKRKKENELK